MAPAPTRDAFAAADTVNIMAYHHKGPHATFEAAQADVKAIIDQGVPGEKIVLGLPFYGRHVSKDEVTLPYRQIVARYKPAPYVDEGRVDLFRTARKRSAARPNSAPEHRLGGIMIWELGQDAEGGESSRR